MDPDTGVVKALESKIRFGFASYKGHQASSETDPGGWVLESDGQRITLEGGACASFTAGAELEVSFRCD